jgi:UDP-N-acetylmuramoylalanine--D-glutamate ligase
MDLKNKNIALLGLGMENHALARYLLKHKIDCRLTVLDARCRSALLKLPNKKIKWILGKNYDQRLSGYDLIVRAPGYPKNAKNLLKAKKAGVKITSAVNLFFDFCPTEKIIGVTGTKGKGTTASLIYGLLKKSGQQVFLGGNIGIAPFNFIDRLNKNSWVVLELSSFHLEDIKHSPRLAVITNFYAEHLAPADPVNPNYHESLKDYWSAKLKIASWQNSKDYLIANQKLKTRLKNSKIKSGIRYFDRSSLKSKLIGEHNKENVAAAVAVAKILKIKPSIIKRAVGEFKGLEHRLEPVKTIRGVKFYNDSFATTPESSILALKSFKQPIVLLCGGADKKSDFKQFAAVIKKKVKFVVLLDGLASPKIKKELFKNKFPENNLKPAFNINQAVKQAQSRAETGEIVLLSTGCASFGMFKNYKERGRLFKQAVNRLK